MGKNSTDQKNWLNVLLCKGYKLRGKFLIRLEYLTELDETEEMCWETKREETGRNNWPSKGLF
jgi:hypothetical protein